MNKAIVTSVACLAIGASVFPQAASARHSQFRDQDRYIERYCDGNWDRDCDDWRDNRHSWNESRYDRWYRGHRDYFGPDDAAASVFGFIAGAAAGAITGSINGGVGGSHVARCEARYRSYNPDTDMFRSLDGDWRYCRL